MKPFLLFLSLFSLAQHGKAQLEVAYSPTLQEEQTRKDKPKSRPIMYNSLGYHIPLKNNNDIMIGGSSIAYKHWGFCVTYRVGIANFLLPNGKRGEITYENVVGNDWPITGNKQQATVFVVNGCLAKSITKKIPLYAGPGVIYQREFFEYMIPGISEPEWNVNPNTSDFQMNYCAGLFIPLIGRFLLNVEYNHNPQTIFVGIVIRDKLAYVDMDDW